MDSVSKSEIFDSYHILDKPGQHIKKQRHHFAEEGLYIVKLWFFSSSHVWMWELHHKEGWVLKNWCFQTVVLRSTLESPLDGKAIKPVNPKETNPNYSLERLMLKLKLWYFGHLMQRADTLEQTLMQGKIEGRRRREWQRMSWLNGITNSKDTNLSKLWETEKDKKAWRAMVHRVTKSQTWLSD